MVRKVNIPEARSVDELVADAKETGHRMHNLGAVKWSGTIGWTEVRAGRLYTLHHRLTEMNSDNFAFTDIATKCRDDQGIPFESGGQAFHYSLRTFVDFAVPSVEPGKMIVGSFKLSIFEDQKGIGSNKFQICPIGDQTAFWDKKILLSAMRLLCEDIRAPQFWPSIATLEFSLGTLTTHLYPFHMDPGVLLAALVNSSQTKSDGHVRVNMARATIEAKLCSLDLGIYLPGELVIPLKQSVSFFPTTGKCQFFLKKIEDLEKMTTWISNFIRLNPKMVVPAVDRKLLKSTRYRMDPVCQLLLETKNCPLCVGSDVFFGSSIKFTTKDGDASQLFIETKKSLRAEKKEAKKILDDRFKPNKVKPTIFKPKLVRAASAAAMMITTPSSPSSPSSSVPLPIERPTRVSTRVSRPPPVSSPSPIPLKIRQIRWTEPPIPPPLKKGPTRPVAVPKEPSATPATKRQPRVPASAKLPPPPTVVFKWSNRLKRGPSVEVAPTLLTPSLPEKRSSDIGNPSMIFYVSNPTQRATRSAPKVAVSLSPPRFSAASTLTSFRERSAPAPAPAPALAPLAPLPPLHHQRNSSEAIFSELVAALLAPTALPQLEVKAPILMQVSSTRARRNIMDSDTLTIEKTDLLLPSDLSLSDSGAIFSRGVWLSEDEGGNALKKKIVDCSESEVVRALLCFSAEEASDVSILGRSRFHPTEFLFQSEDDENVFFDSGNRPLLIPAAYKTPMKTIEASPASMLTVKRDFRSVSEEPSGLGAKKARRSLLSDLTPFSDFSSLL